MMYKETTLIIKREIIKTRIEKKEVGVNKSRITLYYDGIAKGVSILNALNF